MVKVFLSAGHGGSDPGAVAYGMKEKDLNLAVMLACNEELVRHGVTTVLSRTKDENDPVGQEVTEANASGADLAVSFHKNAGRGDGFEAFYWSTSAAGKKLAQLAEKYIKELGQNSRGIKTGNHLYFIKKTKMVAVLFESFFVDSDKDNDIGDTEAELKAIGVAYAKAILEYLGIKYKEKTAAQPTPAPTPAPAKPAKTKVNQAVLNWQKAAMADGFKFPKYGADGQWGSECEAVAAKAIVKKRTTTYKYMELTRIVQRAVGCTVDGKFGNNTKAAVIAYQKNHGLTADGCVGLNTWKKILGV